MKVVSIDYERLQGAMKMRQQEVAAGLGIHDSTLTRKLQGRVRIHFDDLNQMAELLGRDVTDFLIISDG